MTAPRQVLPGTTYLVTRRCTGRTFLLRPDRAAIELFLYSLARAASLYGIQLHACCTMSNHFHLVLTDPRATLPAFMRLLDSLTARAGNHLRGRRDHFWEGGEYSAVALGDADDVVDKMGYTLANPVAAGLVRAARLWPGAWSRPEWIGGEARLQQKPKRFFRQKGGLPDVIPLTFTAPRGFRSLDELRRRVAEALAAREAQAHLERGPRGFLDARRVLEQHWLARPKRQERLGELRPRLAAGKRWLREELKVRLALFVAEYRAALSAWRLGRRQVRFPAGTYQLRVVHRASCARAA